MDALIGRATGVGSWPGTDVQDAARTTFGRLGEAPHLPYLPELPERGPGADVIGRGAVLLVDLPVDLQPSGWRLVDHPGRDLQRARSWLRQDLDVLAEVADGYVGPLKVQVTGPWTLAASVYLPRLERALVDPGACRDLVDSLAQGVADHVAEVRRLVPGASITVQVDEPSLTAVLSGELPTASGFGRLRPVEEPVVVEGLATVLRAAGDAPTVLHCCAAGAPVDTLVRTGASAVAVDVDLLGTPGWEQVAVAIESGTALWAGVDLPDRGRPDTVADAVWTPWRTLGLPAAAAGAVVLTPTCGLAGRTVLGAKGALKLLTEAAADLAERSLT